MAFQDEEPKNGLIAAVGIGSVVVLIATMFGLQSYFNHLKNEEQQAKILGVDNPELKLLHGEEDRILNNYASLDANRTHVRIPIERAMELLAKRGRNGVPSIAPDPEKAVIAPAGGAATTSTPKPMPVPTTSSSAPSPDDKPEEKGTNKDEDKKKDKDKKDKDKKDKDKKDKDKKKEKKENKPKKED